MCGRFYLEADRQTLLSEFALSESTETVTPHYNITPAMNIDCIIQEDDQNRLVRMRWGLVPFWSKGIDPRYSMYNARAETLQTKPAFKKPYTRSRCLIPVSGYYEWHEASGRKNPYAITCHEQSIVALAGIWDRWHDEKVQIDSCAIITKEANPQLSCIHHRMPVSIHPMHYADWLNPNITDPDALEPIMFVNDSINLSYWAISSSVNSPKNNSVDLLQPAS